MPLFITAVLDGSLITINGDRQQSRDFTFVENVIQANLKAAVAPKAAGEVFNVACGNSTSLNQVIDHLRTITEVDTEVVHGPDRAGDIKHSLASIDKARELMGYNPAVSVESGLRMSVEWYRAARKGPSTQ